jgi:hypothetical protein
MVAIPLRAHAPFVLVAMTIFWCGAVAGMLILHSTSATEPATEPAISTPAQTKTVRIVAVRGALPMDKTTPPATTTFDDRWSAHEWDASPTAIKDARAQFADGETKPTTPDLRREQPDPVCGARGRRYYYVGQHKYWRCRR